MKELLEKIRAYNPKADLNVVKRLTSSPPKRTARHKRLSGEPYITHPLAVAMILADLEQDR